jgi:hypothetical protein
MKQIKPQTIKQKLASNRNWFKFILMGLIKPLQTYCLTDEERIKWNQIIQLKNELLESFDSNSINKGLKVTDKCWCGREGKYPNPCPYEIPVKLVCKKHSTPETFRT